MTLGDAVAQTFHVLSQARDLFGPAPADGAWTTTPQLTGARNAIAGVGQAAATGWSGGAAQSYGVANGGQQFALDGAIAGDHGTAPPVTGTGQAATDGGAGLDGVIDDTHSGVAAIAPATGTPAGKQEMLTHLQTQIARAKAELAVSQQRGAQLAALIARGSAGYGGGGMGGGMGGMGGGMPMGMGGGGGGGLPIPALSSLIRGHHHGAESADWWNPKAEAGGTAAQDAVKAALSKLGRPYVWGAKGPNQFDCSGLTRWAYAQAGVTLGSDTYAQVKDGRPVAHGDVRAGDLIFPEPGHVQLAISPTQVVEAQQSGVPVKISPMPSSYVARRVS